MAEDARIGSELAGYRIVAVAGRGGMGVVYIAEDARLGRRVALKLLSSELAADERFRERFVRESRLAASIEHPHIVPIYAAGEADGTLFIAMRYIDGIDLRTLLAEHVVLDPAHAAGLVHHVAEALDAAHERGLVHRDVKPANVLVETRAGRDHAYLTDFGLTKQASSVSGFTGTGQLVGTIDYLSPEQIEGRPADGRSDQYALGCVLYQCLAGRPPFQRESEAATLWAHVQEAPPSIADARPDLAGELDPVLRRALAKRPEQRFPTCQDFAATARSALHVRPLPAVSRARRRLMLVMLAVTFALVTAIVIAVIAGSEGGGAAPPRVYHFHLVRLGLSSKKPVGSPVGIPGSGGGDDIAAGGGRVFVGNSVGLVAFDPRSHTTTVRRIQGGAYSVAIGGGRVWVSAADPTGSADALVYAYDELGLVSQSIAHVRRGLLSQGGRNGERTRTEPLVTAAGGVWAPTYQGILRFDEQDPTAEPRMIASQIGGHFVIAAGPDDVWTVTAVPGELTHIDAVDRRVLPPLRFPTLESVRAIAAAQGAVWVAVATASSATAPNMFEINPGSGGAFVSLRLPGSIVWLAGSRSSLLAGYYPDTGGFAVAAVDPTGRATTVMRLGTAVTAATITGDTAWLLLWDGR
jgi:Protein kinase domain